MSYLKLFLVVMLLSVFSFCSSEEDMTTTAVEEVEETEDTMEEDNTDIDDTDTTEEDTTTNENEGTLDPDVAPSENFDLSTWKLTVPIADTDGYAKDISVSDLNNNYQHSDYFYTAADGGMVFYCRVDGKRTSANTSYARTELREMLRGTNTSISTKGVNKNNWVFGTAPQADLTAAAAYNGKMTATLAVNHVTTTGDTSKRGRVVIGQIHANDDEPIRLYYRKLPDNDKGSIYFAHEPATGYGDEVWIDVLGSKSSSAVNPEDGIALNEKFTYTIEVVGDLLTVVLSREGKEDIVKTHNMSASGYNVGGQYMYFKAGVYVQNNEENGADSSDYDQATFYKLETSHTL